MSIETKIKDFISDNMLYAVGRTACYCDPTPEAVLEMFMANRTLSEDLAEIVKENLPGWGNIALSEECFYDQIEKIDAVGDIYIFKGVLDRFLTKYALKVLIDGEAEIIRNLPKDTTEQDELDRDYDKMKFDNLREAV